MVIKYTLWPENGWFMGIWGWISSQIIHLIKQALPVMLLWGFGGREATFGPRHWLLCLLGASQSPCSGNNYQGGYTHTPQSSPACSPSILRPFTLRLPLGKDWGLLIVQRVLHIGPHLVSQVFMLPFFSFKNIFKWLHTLSIFSI